MIKYYRRNLLPIITMMKKGTIISVPNAKMLLGRTFRIGDFDNTACGKALASIARSGSLVLHKIEHSYNGIPTTIHYWEVV